jgi:hypothetical protein
VLARQRPAAEADRSNHRELSRHARGRHGIRQFLPQLIASRTRPITVPIHQRAVYRETNGSLRLARSRNQSRYRSGFRRVLRTAECSGPHFIGTELSFLNWLSSPAMGRSKAMIKRAIPALIAVALVGCSDNQPNYRGRFQVHESSVDENLGTQERLPGTARARPLLVEL